MTNPFEVELSFARGYWPNQGKVGRGRVPDTLIAGKNAWIEGPDRLRAWGGTALLPVSIGNSIMQLTGVQIGTLTSGSAALYRNAAVFFIGSGPYNESTLAIATASPIGTASSTLKFTLTRAPGSALTAGLPTPAAPTIDDGAAATTGSGRPQPGTYSCKITFYRTDTGAESNSSEVSNIYTADGTKKLRITVPNQTVSPGTDGGINGIGGTFTRRIYLSKRGFPQGPWFLVFNSLTNNLVGGAGAVATVDIDTLDGDLLDITAPLDGENNPPPTGTHCFALENVMVVAGCFGGGGIAYSKPNKPEAFPVEQVTFLNPNETISGIRGRAADGWQYVFCRNSLHAVYYTGDPEVPIGVRAIWPDIGIANASAAAFVGGEFYCYSAKKGALRTTAGNQTAEPDGVFALPVESDMDRWTPANVVVGWDQDSDAVFYFAPDPDDTSNTVALAYMRKQNVWSLPFKLADSGLTGIVRSCVTYQGQLIVTTGTGGTGAMRSFDSASPTIAWEAIPAWNDGGTASWYKTITGFRAPFDFKTDVTNDFTAELLTNFDTTNVRARQTAKGTNTGGDYTPWKKCNTKNSKVFTVRLKGTGANKYAFPPTVVGGSTKMRVG